jgi:hypothetical protein
MEGDVGESTHYLLLQSAKPRGRTVLVKPVAIAAVANIRARVV